MWTGKFSRYFMVLLCASSFNAAWGQKTVKVYFNEKQASGVPTLSLSDAPVGVSVSQSGFTWASKYKFSALVYPNCTDRVVVMKSDTAPSTASISFSGFKYEVKQVKWNVICDYLAGAPVVATTIIPEKGKEITGRFS
ncbi:MAG: hypothetical protein II669_04080, partial [Elusimicrobia bacterium]|nr:hypothetical protein [Elusimicrobiota bacterium]